MTSHRCFAPKGALYFGLLLFLLVPPGARADSVVFSNFGPGIGFDPTIGWVGPAGTAYSVGGVPFDVAVSFTPSSNVDLSQIFLPILWQIPDPPNSTTVTLVNSAGGAPGATVLESWSGLTVPSLSFSPPLTLTSSPDVLLSAGTQYWIVVGTEGSDFWFQNNSGGTQPFDFGSGTSWTVIDPLHSGVCVGYNEPCVRSYWHGASAGANYDLPSRIRLPGIGSTRPTQEKNCCYPRRLRDEQFRSIVKAYRFSTLPVPVRAESSA